MSDQSYRIRVGVGDRIGKLTVLSRLQNVSEGRAVRTRWLCLCDCGRRTSASSHSLSKGLRGLGGVRSCGCLMGKAMKHGKTYSRVYKVWHMMKQRCMNPRNGAYKDYGGRGITVDESWLGFKAFYADMGDPPAGYTLEREDNSAGYSKENCKWASRLEQGNNRRTNLFIEFNGQRKTLSDWSRALGLSTVCISNRLNRGWSIEKTLTTPKLGYLKTPKQIH